MKEVDDYPTVPVTLKKRPLRSKIKKTIEVKKKKTIEVTKKRPLRSQRKSSDHVGQQKNMLLLQLESCSRDAENKTKRTSS